MGLRSAALTSRAAYWSSWADCLEMIAARNPGVADMIVTEMGQADAGFHVSGASEVREQLVEQCSSGTCELDCAHQASEWTNDMWASQVMGGNTRRPKQCMRICSARQIWPRLSPPSFDPVRGFDPVTRRPDVRGPLHVLPCEPGVQDRLVFVQGVAAASPLASLASFLPQLPVWPST